MNMWWCFVFVKFFSSVGIFLDVWGVVNFLECSGEWYELGKSWAALSLSFDSYRNCQGYIQGPVAPKWERFYLEFWPSIAINMQHQNQGNFHAIRWILENSLNQIHLKKTNKNHSKQILFREIGPRCKIFLYFLNLKITFKCHFK